MRTETQRNFYQQMKELSKEREELEDTKVYSYINKDFVDNKVIYRRRRLITLSGVIAIIIIGIYFAPSLISMLNQISAYNQKPVLVYVQRIGQYDNQLSQTSKSINTEVKRLNMKSSASRKRFGDFLNIRLNSVLSIVNEIKSITEPKGLEDYKHTTLIKYQNYSKALKYYITGVRRNDRDNLNKARGIFGKFNTDIRNQNSSLINVFNKFKIQYTVQKNGNITYWNKAINDYN